MQGLGNIDTQVLVQVGISLGIIIGFKILSSVIASIIIRIFTPKRKREKNYIKNSPFYKPLRIMITFLGIYVAFVVLKSVVTFSPEAQKIIGKTIKILLILFLAKTFGDSIEEKNGIIRKLSMRKNKKIDESSFDTIAKVIKVCIYIISGFMIISELGYDISAFVASLGIGGIVLTIAAQDTAKNFIGGVAIFLDKPFKVGDYIKVGQHEGTVEEIRFRCTNIRTLENSVLHIPNSEMSIATIVNFSEMEKRRYNLLFTLDFDVSLEIIEKIKTEIKEVLAKNQDIIPDTLTVVFEKIGISGIDLMVNCYLYEVNYIKFLDVKEKINYQVMDILEKNNVKLAYNTQTVILKK